MSGMQVADAVMFWVRNERWIAESPGFEDRVTANGLKLVFGMRPARKAVVSALAPPIHLAVWCGAVVRTVWKDHQR
jgi:hypothetical protein